MTYWYIPNVLDADTCSLAIEKDQLVLPSEGMADLAKAQFPDQIANKVRQLNPQSTPEFIQTKTDHYWKLRHEVLVEDAIVFLTSRNTYMVGEITGPYRYENTALGPSHVWPVRWHHTGVQPDLVPKLETYRSVSTLSEISDEEILTLLRTYSPSFRKGSASFFRWLSIIILIAELIYFWPSGKNGP